MTCAGVTLAAPLRRQQRFRSPGEPTCLETSGNLRRAALGSARSGARSASAPHTVIGQAPDLFDRCLKTAVAPQS